MKRIIIALSALLVPAVISAQGVDFSGSWKLDASKSTLNAEFSMAPKAIIIEQKGNDLKIEKHSTFQEQEITSTDKLTMDGKECINPGFMESQKKSTAIWSEDKASLKIASKLNIGDGGEMTITEVYKLNAGNLVLESAAASSYGELKETMIYTK